MTPTARRGPGRPPLMTANQRRALLIETAVVEFARHGPRTTVEIVARAAGVAKPSLYELFDSKEALLEAAVSHEVDEMAARVGRTYRQPPGRSIRTRTRERVAAVFAYAEERPHGLALLLAVQRGNLSERALRRSVTVRAAMAEELAAVLRADFASAGIETTASAEILAAMAVEATLVAAERALSRSGTDPHAVVDMVTTLLTSAFTGVSSEEMMRVDRPNSDTDADGYRVGLGG